MNNNSSIKRFQRGWRILAIFVAAFWVVSLVYSLTTTPLYRASATFLVYPNDTFTSSRDVVSSLDTLDKRSISTTYADILDSNRIFSDTVDRLQLDPATLGDVKIYAEVQADTNILVLSVEGPDPQVITLLANNIGQNGISFIQSIYQVYDISFLDMALEPDKPFHPRPLVDGLIAAAIGLGVGLVILILRELLRLPLEAMKERSVLDKQSLAHTRKFQLRALSQEVAKKDVPLAFGMIHLQGLEDLIEQLPERLANDLMQEVVHRLHNTLRGNDVVARWEKLVFSIMLPNTPETPAIKTFERLALILDTPIRFESGDQITLSPVCGLTIRKDDEAADRITERSEKALHRARNGEGKIVVEN